MVDKQIEELTLNGKAVRYPSYLDFFFVGNLLS